VTTVEQVRERARRRVVRWWYWQPAYFAGLLAVFDLIGGESITDVLFAAGGALVGGGAFVAFVARSRSVHDPVNLTLRRGLPRAERRAVRRDIWRRDPSLDPTLLAIEFADATVMVRTYLWLALGGVGASGFSWWLALGNADGHAGIRLVAALVTVVTLGSAAWCLSCWYAARRFLGPLRRATR
jgi:hypothetical protein